MRISRAILDDIVLHAQAQAPNECCGIIASKAGQAVKLYRARNAAASPLRYELDPHDQYKIEMEIYDKGWELGAIYHSHTQSPPFPSQTDINLAQHPDALYIIVGLAEPQTEIRAWRIVEGKVEVGELEVGS
jgi:proteasome lid subunit RPN8/RPN11